MSKFIKRNINSKLKKLISCRIKSKKQIIKIIVHLCQMINADYKPEESDLGEVFIYYGDVRRVFISLKIPPNNKIKHFSFSFPFKIRKTNNNYTITTYNKNFVIESVHLAVLENISEKNAFCSKESQYGVLFGFTELIEAELDDIGLTFKLFEEQLNQILLELFLFEPSYIRYDDDLDNMNNEVHPRYHLDVYYSQNTTFKIGCNQMELKHFINVLDNSKIREKINNEHIKG